MKKRSLIILLLLLIGCQDESTPLSGDELSLLLATDRKISFSRFQIDGTAALNSDKTFIVNIPALGSDRGIWWIEGDKLCSKWDVVQKGTDICAIIAQYPDGTYEGLNPSSKTHLGNFQIIE